MSILISGPADLSKETSRVLLVADESSLEKLAEVVAGLPVRVRGQVFIEVPSIDTIGLLPTPELVTVSWLARESRSGIPGSCGACRPGQALDRAVRAWVGEMQTGDADLDGGTLAVWFGATGEFIDGLRQNIVTETVASGS